MVYQGAVGAEEAALVGLYATDAEAAQYEAALDADLPAALVQVAPLMAELRRRAAAARG